MSASNDPLKLWPKKMKEFNVALEREQVASVVFFRLF